MQRSNVAKRSYVKAARHAKGTKRAKIANDLPALTNRKSGASVASVASVPLYLMPFVASVPSVDSVSSERIYASKAA